MGLLLACLVTGGFFWGLEQIGWLTSSWPLLKLALGGGLFLWGSLLIHELGHGLVAQYRGVSGGEVTLSWWGGGFAPWEQPAGPADSFWIHVVGPLSHLLLALGCGQFQALGSSGGQDFWTGMIWFQLGLGVANSLPLLPLDGAYLLNSGFWAWTGKRDEGLRRGTRWGAILVSLVGLSGLALVPLSGQAQLLVGVVGGGAVMSSLYLGREYQRFYEGLNKMMAYPLEIALQFQLPRLSPEQNIEQIAPYRLPALVVDENDQPIGLVGTEEQEDAPSSAEVQEIMVPWDDILEAQPDDPLGVVYETAFFRRGLEKRMVVARSAEGQLGAWDIQQVHTLAGWSKGE